MPSSVVERAEKVLLDISWDLSEIQKHGYQIQDSLAKRTHEGYITQKWVLYRKPFIEGMGLASYIIVAYDPSKLIELLKLADKKEVLEIVGRVSGGLTSLLVDPSNVAVQGEIQKLQTGQQELSGFFNHLMGIRQTHEGAIQRLQNMEGANRQAG